MNIVKLDLTQPEAERVYDLLRERMEKLVQEGEPTNRAELHETFYQVGKKLKQALLFIYGMEKLAEEVQTEANKGLPKDVVLFVDKQGNVVGAIEGVGDPDVKTDAEAEAGAK